jgi:rhodanese-related sulfurtransferase
MSEEKFLAVVTKGQPAAPGYFLYNATLNKQQRDVRALDTAVPALASAEVEAALARGAVVHDARDVQEFAAGHLRGSVNVPTDGRMATRLSRIGYDRVVGRVADVEAFLLAHREDVERASRLPVTEADEALARGDVQVVDLRNPGELTGGTIPGAVPIPLAQLAARTGELDPTRPVVVYCAGGWRSSVGASLLRARGFADVSDVLGGFGAWQRAHAAAS